LKKLCAPQSYAAAMVDKTNHEGIASSRRVPIIPLIAACKAEFLFRPNRRWFGASYCAPCHDCSLRIVGVWLDDVGGAVDLPVTKPRDIEDRETIDCRDL